MVRTKVVAEDSMHNQIYNRKWLSGKTSQCAILNGDISQNKISPCDEESTNSCLDFYQTTYDETNTSSSNFISNIDPPSSSVGPVDLESSSTVCKSVPASQYPKVEHDLNPIFEVLINSKRAHSYSSCSQGDISDNNFVPSSHSDVNFYGSLSEISPQLATAVNSSNISTDIDLHHAYFSTPSNASDNNSEPSHISCRNATLTSDNQSLFSDDKESLPIISASWTVCQCGFNITECACNTNIKKEADSHSNLEEQDQPTHGSRMTYQRRCKTPARSEYFYNVDFEWDLEVDEVDGNAAVKRVANKIKPKTKQNAHAKHFELPLLDQSSLYDDGKVNINSDKPSKDLFQRKQESKYVCTCGMQVMNCICKPENVCKERQGLYWTNPVYVERPKQLARKRYKSDPKYKEKCIASGRLRYATNASTKVGEVDAGAATKRVEKTVAHKIKPKTKQNPRAKCLKLPLLDQSSSCSTGNVNINSNKPSTGLLKRESKDVCACGMKIVQCICNPKDVSKERRGLYWTNPAYRERLKQRAKERYKSDPNFRERCIAQGKLRYATNASYRERQLQRMKIKYATDPEFREKCKLRGKSRKP